MPLGAKNEQKTENNSMVRAVRVPRVDHLDLREAAVQLGDAEP